MRRLFLLGLLAIATIFFVTACGSDNGTTTKDDAGTSEQVEESSNATEKNDTDVSEAPKEDEQTSEEAVDVEDEVDQADKQDSANTESETEADQDNSTISDYPEYKVFQDEVKRASKLKGSVVEDNRNKRIMLFEDNSGRKEYKTIYIKHKNSLKIISLKNGEKPIYNSNIGG